MWAELYERAAFMRRDTVVAALGGLCYMTAAELRPVWAELGFCARWPGRKAGIERIKRRILDRHDTYVRVNL